MLLQQQSKAYRSISEIHFMRKLQVLSTQIVLLFSTTPNSFFSLRKLICSRRTVSWQIQIISVHSSSAKCFKYFPICFRSRNVPLETWSLALLPLVNSSALKLHNFFRSFETFQSQVVTQIIRLDFRNATFDSSMVTFFGSYSEKLGNLDFQQNFFLPDR